MSFSLILSVERARQSPWSSSGRRLPKRSTLLELSSTGRKNSVCTKGLLPYARTSYLRLTYDSENDPSIMSTTLNLRPGTHHLKFIVDGEMRAADNLPTAVDFTNHLVNYIEIGADDTHDPHLAVQPGAHAPQTIPDSSKQDHAGDAEDHLPETEETEEEMPPGDFGSAIPQFLADLDKEEDSPAYAQAANIIGDTATPPSLPLFLGKSILNGTTPMKDDSSVLNYPNHTVLNHLATSSIKNGVLATSVTTRYKRKVGYLSMNYKSRSNAMFQYVTTILYKPTGDITGE